MSAKIRNLQAQKAETIKAMRELNDAAADGVMSAEQQAEFEELENKVASLNAAIAREQRLAAEEAGLGEPAAGPSQRGPPAAARGEGSVTIPAKATVTVTENVANDPRGGFASAGEYYMKVREAAFAQQQGVAVDRRLVMLNGGMQAAAPSTYGNEAVGADGGWLVPVEFSKTVFTLSLAEDSLLPMCDDIPVEGNGMSFPKDETTPWGTNGVRAYWAAEAATAQLSKPVVDSETLRLKKLFALVPMTDELMEDATALGAYLTPKMATSIRWKANEAILFGAGGGIPLGAMISNAVITVAKESGQSSNTLVKENIANMIARLPPGSFPRAVWMMNNDVLPALFTLNSNNQLIYLPTTNPGQGAMQGSPYGTLMGRPIMVSQHAKSFSSQGDVMLVDLSYYQAITKSQGMETATSMHLYFDAGLTAFRTTFRMDGQPKLSKAIDPANGSNKLSPFVQLGAR